MARILRRALFLGAAMLAVGMASAAEPPRKVTISGTLRDSAGHPLDGVYTLRVELEGNNVDTTATLTAGTFNVRVPVPGNLTDRDTIRYRLWADLDGNGLDGGDRFPDEFTLTTVPRAHEVPPLERWKVGVFEGWRGSTLFNDITPLTPQPLAKLSAFVAPETGLRVNAITYQASTNVAPFFQMQGETHYEIGVYDPEGKLAIRARMPLRLPAAGTYMQVVVPETVLPPGRGYVAIASDIAPQGGSRPSIGYASAIDDYKINYDYQYFDPKTTRVAAPGGRLPETLANPRNTVTGPGPALILQYLPEAAELPVGAYRRADSESRYDWILPSAPKGSFF